MTASVVATSRVAVSKLTGRGVIRVNPDRFSSTDFRCHAGAAVIELAVQSGPRLVGDQMQRVARGPRPA